jgi:hypothetical protein
MDTFGTTIYEVGDKDPRTGLEIAQRIAVDLEALTTMLTAQSNSKLSVTFSDKEVVADKAVDVLVSTAVTLTKLGLDWAAIDNLIRAKLTEFTESFHSQNHKYPFEIHITVAIPNGDLRDEYIHKFAQVCSDIRVKPIILDLTNQSNTHVMNDATTSSKFFGTEEEVHHEVERISSSLAQNGFEVIRRKIETAVWHENGAAEKLGDGQYFECHVGLFIPSETLADRMNLLSSICKAHSAHLSRNTMKKPESGRMVQMATVRTYASPDFKAISHRQFFEDKITAFAHDLTSNGFEYEKLVYEFALFDTKNDHDVAWLSSNK